MYNFSPVLSGDVFAEQGHAPHWLGGGVRDELPGPPEGGRAVRRPECLTERPMKA